MSVEMVFYYEEGKKRRSVWSLFTTLSETRVFDCIVGLCDKSNLVFYGLAENRGIICTYTGLSDITVKHVIARIVKKGALVKIGRAKYRLNPVYVRVNNRKIINK
jgi:hypothetical protein